MPKNIVSILFFLSVSYSTSEQVNQGYLVANYSNITPYCERPEPNDACNMTNRTVEFVDGRMKRNRDAVYSKIKSTYESLDIGQIAASVSCKKSIAEHFCSEIFICDNANSSFAQNAEKKRRACLTGKNSCSEEVQTQTGIRFENCENITSNPITIPKRCIGLPDTNVCPSRTFKVSKGKNVLLYNLAIHIAKQNLEKLKSNYSSSCLQILTNIYCYLYGGPVCSDDERLLVHVISRQECQEALKKCFSVRKITWIQSVFDKCSSLPNNTSTRVPLPEGINARSILEPTMEKNGTSPTNGRNGDGNGPKDGDENGKGGVNRNEKITTNIAVVATVMIYTVYFILS